MEEGLNFYHMACTIFLAIVSTGGDDIVHVDIGTCTYNYTLGCTCVSLVWN